MSSRPAAVTAGWYISTVHKLPLFPVLRVGALATFVLALLYARERSPSTAPEAPAVPGVWATDVDGGAAPPVRPGAQATGPLEGQKRPPCNKDIETELVGACWVRHYKAPPCPPGLYEGNGMCLLPVLAAQRPGTSLGR